MQDDCIVVALELPELMILGQVELDDHFEVTVRYRRDKVGCSTCGSTCESMRVHFNVRKTGS